MNTHHTPGPWITLGNYTDSLHFSSLAIYNQYLMPVCFVNGNVSDMGRNESNANAYLILAAPDLLAALLDMVSVYSGQVQNDGGYAVIDTIARSALAKATQG